MPGDGTRQPLLLTANGHRSHPNGSLDLGHCDASLGQSIQPSDDSTSPKFDDEKTMRLAEWLYLSVEEVWSGFNLPLSHPRGFEAHAVDGGEAGQLVEEFNRAVSIEDEVRMWVKNALVYGRCIMEAGDDLLKVRNPHNIEIEQDDGEIVSVTQEIDADPTDFDPDDV